MEEPIFCPFCGHSDKTYISKYQSNGSWVYTVGCSLCSSTGPVGKTEDEAVEGWNQRFVAVGDQRRRRRKKGETE